MQRNVVDGRHDGPEDLPADPQVGEEGVLVTPQKVNEQVVLTSSVLVVRRLRRLLFDAHKLCLILLYGREEASTSLVVCRHCLRLEIGPNLLYGQKSSATGSKQSITFLRRSFAHLRPK